MARILSVVWGPFPDIRLEKTGRLLGEAGHGVDVLCLSAVPGEWKWGEVILAPLPSNPVLRLVRRLGHEAAHDPTAFPWRYLAAFRTVFARGRYDVVLWNDLPGVVAAAELAHATGARLLFDMHENHADNMWSTERDEGRPSYRYNVNAWSAYERRALDAVDRVIVNIEEMGARLIGMHGVDPMRIDVVRNAEPPDLWPQAQADPAYAARFSGRRVLLYVGGLSRHRGIDVIVKAMALVRDRLPDFAFVVVGDGNGLAEWLALSHSLRLDDVVIFEGRKPFREAQNYYRIAEFGVIPHHQYGQTDNGIPHKLAQNFIAGLPVLVSSCHALERIIRDTGAGRVFRAGEPSSAAEEIVALANRDIRAKAAAAARRVVTDGQFAWERMRADLLAAFGKLSCAA